jgi:hypothetical protein
MNIKELINELEKKATRQGEKEAVAELEKDLYFERKLQKDMNRQLNEITAFIYLYLLRNNQVPDVVTPFTPDMVALLRKNYKKIADFYSKTIRRRLGATVTKEVSNEVKVLVDNFIKEQSFISANNILTTSQKDALIAFERSAIQDAVSGQMLTYEQIAKNVKTILDEANKGRLKTIAITEVGKTSETSKMIEATQIHQSGVINNETILQSMKDWNSVLDGKTRPAHAMADGQSVPINEPFIVDGERLMFPKDSSLGASAKNIINCRCKASYSYKTAPRTDDTPLKELI